MHSALFTCFLSAACQPVNQNVFPCRQLALPSICETDLTLQMDVSLLKKTLPLLFWLEKVRLSLPNCHLGPEADVSLTVNSLIHNRPQMTGALIATKLSMLSVIRVTCHFKIYPWPWPAWPLAPSATRHQKRVTIMILDLQIATPSLLPTSCGPLQKKILVTPFPSSAKLIVSSFMRFFFPQPYFSYELYL